MGLEPFRLYFSDYITAIREAKQKGASHDYLRQVFIEFARKSFRVDPVDVELEKGIKGAKLRGSIDALYQDIVFEFKRDLKLEREKGKEELERYLQSLGDKQVFFGVLTDGLAFEVYLLQDNALRKIDEANLDRLPVDDAFLWFDAFLFSEKELAPTSQDVVKRFGDTSPVFNSSFHSLSRMLSSAKDDPSCQVKFRDDQSAGLVLADGVTLNICQLIRAVLFKHSQHPGSKVTHYRSHRLPMVLTVVDHLAMDGPGIATPASGASASCKHTAVDEHGIPGDIGCCIRA